MSIAENFYQSTKVKYKKGFEKPPDFSDWPQEWKTIYFKSYPRLPRIFLPKPVKMDFPLGESLIIRRSERDFDGRAINLKDLSQLLFYSAGVTEKKGENWNSSHRPYPSGGARFPLEVYLFSLKGSQELKAGIYHYNVKEHSLEEVLKEDSIREQIYPEAVWQKMMLKAPLLLAISAVFYRNTMKYKERGHRYILFEAGHLGQNIYLSAAALNLKCCGIGGFGDDKLHELLDVDGKGEAVLYSFAIGR